MSGLSKLFDIECSSDAVLIFTCSIVGVCFTATGIWTLFADDGGVLLFDTVDVSVLFGADVVKSLVVLLLPNTNFWVCLVGSTILTRNRDD